MKATSGVSTITRERSITQRVASNFGWSLVSEAVGKGVFFFTNIYLARALGVENFGLFTIAQTLTLYFWLAVDMGMNMYGIREIAKRKHDPSGLISQLLTLRLTAGVVVFALYAVNVVLFVGEHKNIFLASGVYLLTYAFYTDCVLKGLEKFKLIAFGSIISSAIFFAGIIVLVRTQSDVAVAALIWSISFFFGSMFLFYIVVQRLGLVLRPDFRLRVWMLHIKESIFFTLSGSLMMLYQYLPIFLLGILYSAHEVGIFSAPYKVIFAVCSLGFYVPMAFYPVMSEQFHIDSDGFIVSYKRLRFIMLAMGLPAGAAGTFFATRMVTLLFGADYIESVLVFKMLSWLVPMYFLRYSYGITMNAMDGQRLRCAASAVCVVVMLTIGTALTFIYGLPGCVIGLMLSEIALIIFLGRQVNRKMEAVYV